MTTHNTKDRILHATLKLITEHGFEGTSVSKIAQEVGITVGAIYKHFKSKEAIINELYSNIVKILNEAMTANVPESLTYKEIFYLHWRNLLNFFINNEYEGKFVSQYINSPKISKTLADINDARFNYHRELLARGIRDKQIREIDFDVIALYMWATVKQLHYLHINNAAKLTEKYLNDIFEVFWEGIKA